VKVVVFGAGAVGSLLGAILSRTHEVTLIGRAPHVDAIRNHGLQVEGNETFRVQPDARTSTAGLGPADLVLLSVKAFDTAAALRELSPLMGPKTILINIQNGLGNWEQARRAYPKNHVLGASVMYGAMTPKPGVVHWSGPGEVTIGGILLDSDAVEAARAALKAGGVNVRTTDNIAGVLWMKAIINAAINPLTALHRVPNGRLLEDPALRQALRRATEEAVRVAHAEGIRLPAPDPIAEVERVVVMTKTNRSSMLQSIEKGLPTEIEAITGAILGAAGRHGIACPENERLYQAIKKLGLAPVR
jgi:2-dehydropantoate 2-reductase